MRRCIFKRGRYFIFVANPGTFLKDPRAKSSCCTLVITCVVSTARKTPLSYMFCVSNVIAGLDSSRGIRKKQQEFNDVKHPRYVSFPFQTVNEHRMLAIVGRHPCCQVFLSFTDRKSLQLENDAHSSNKLRQSLLIECWIQRCIDAVHSWQRDYRDSVNTCFFALERFEAPLSSPLSFLFSFSLFPIKKHSGKYSR